MNKKTKVEICASAIIAIMFLANAFSVLGNTLLDNQTLTIGWAGFGYLLGSFLLSILYNIFVPKEHRDIIWESLTT